MHHDFLEKLKELVDHIICFFNLIIFDVFDIEGLYIYIYARWRALFFLFYFCVLLIMILGLGPTKIVSKSLWDGFGKIETLVSSFIALASSS